MSQRMIYQTEATRDKIISTAEGLFVSNGFADTQMKDIATAVGVSRNTLYRYYQDKYDLGFSILVEVLKRKFEIYQSVMIDIKAGKYDSILRGLEVLMYSYVDPEHAEDDRFIAEFDGYFAGSRIPSEFRQKLKEHLTPRSGISLEDIFSMGQADGSIRDDISAHYLSVTIFNAVPNFYRRMLLRENALMEIEAYLIPRLTPVLIQLLIDGLKPQK